MNDYIIIIIIIIVTIIIIIIIIVIKFNSTIVAVNLNYNVVKMGQLKKYKKLIKQELGYNRFYKNYKQLYSYTD